MISTASSPLRLPLEFRKRLTYSEERREVHRLLREKKLHTVCEEARCPNIAECFSNKTATFMILGDRCTRRCHFCSVQTARPLPVDEEEPKRLAQAALALGLEHVVITSVDRDELPDTGAGHFAACIRELKKQLPSSIIELLTPDFKGKQAAIDTVLEAEPHIWGHNIETVERLYKKLRPQSSWEVTTSLLTYASQRSLVKSGMMVGLGETDEEVDDTLRLLKTLGVQIVTIGQYLRPSLKHWPVARYVGQENYDRWVALGSQLGFRKIYAGPFVRSSYHAKEISPLS